MPAARDDFADRRGLVMAGGLGLLAGWAADLLVGDPVRHHPVAAFGTCALRLEARTWRDRRAAGIWHTGVLVAGAAGLGGAGARLTRGRPGARALIVAAATWTVLGGRTLTREAEAVAAALRADDLPAARRQVARIVGRDVSTLDADGVARATVETVAENTVDAVVAPLLWGGIAGMPGLLGYRAINTLDAMIGHHSPRYERFGWCAARLDDVANWLPARFTAAAALVLGGLSGGSARGGSVSGGWRAIRRDAPAHPSPNGGVVEAAFAGVLGVRLGGVNVYAGSVQDRGTLGEGPAPTADDIDRANRLSRRIGAVAAVASVAVAGWRWPGGGDGAGCGCLAGGGDPGLGAAAWPGAVIRGR